MSLRKGDFILSCEDFAKAGLWDTRDCCGSCHWEWYEGEYFPLEIWPPDKKTADPDISESEPNSYIRIWGEVCCGIHADLYPKLTRDDWARVIRDKRRRFRREIEEDIYGITIFEHDRLSEMIDFIKSHDGPYRCEVRSSDDKLVLEPLYMGEGFKLTDICSDQAEFSFMLYKQDYRIGTLVDPMLAEVYKNIVVFYLGENSKFVVVNDKLEYLHRLHPSVMKYIQFGLGQ